MELILNVFAFFGYVVVLLLFFVAVITGAIPLIVAVGIIVVITNLMNIFIEPLSPVKKYVRVIANVENFLLIFYLIFTFIAYPMFQTFQTLVNN